MTDSSFTAYRAGWKKAFDWLLILLAASFPFSFQISSVIIVMLLLIWLVGEGPGALVRAIANRFVILSILIFAVSVVSLFFSDDRHFFPIEKRLSLLVLPLLLYPGMKIEPKTRDRVFYSFGLSCTAAMLYTLIKVMGRPELLGSEMTLEVIGISHVYFGLYLSVAIVVLYYQILSRNVFDRIAVLLGAWIVLLLFFVFVLGGKMSIISLLLLALVSALFYATTGKRRLLGVALVLFPVAVFAITIASVDDMRERFLYLINPNNYFVGNNAWNSIGVRMSIFKCVGEVYEKNPLTGTGIGDVQHDLDKCYKDSGFTSLAGMNAHNEYIQQLLESGIVGMGIFVAVLAMFVRQALATRNFLYLSFIFLFGLCCLTESLLERQHGIMFFSFFNALLFFHAGTAEKKTPLV